MKPTEHQHSRYGALWDLTEGQRARYGAAIGVMFAATACTYGMPLIIKWCIDGIVDGQFAGLDTFPLAQGFSNVAILSLAALGAIACTGVGGGFTYLRGRWASMASEAITRRLRNRLFSHLERLPAAFHDRSETGDLIQRCTSDVETLRRFLAAQVVEVGRTVIMVLTVTPVLFWLDVKLALTSLVLIPIIFMLAWKFFGRVKDLFQAKDEAEAAMSARLQENLTGIRVVRAFARQEHEVLRFAEANANFRNQDQRLNVIMAWYWSVSDAVSMTQMGLVLFFGAYWVMTGDISVGTLFAFYTYVGMFIWPIRHLGRVLEDVGKAVVALGRLNHILEEPEESSDEVAPETPIRGRIEIHGLTFGFDPEKPVLSDIDLTIEAGETIALMGPPGSGKSTLAQLLLRLYDYQTGSIQIDATELSALPRDHVRSAVGIVLQDPFLYSRSIRENLLVGKWDATQAELDAACDEAAIAGSIDRFSRGMDAMVGERGVTLSGGQRQRVALARALVRNPPILILDDSLSAVDTGTEQHILGALAARKGRATTLVITHRLSTIADADRIVILNEGRIVQLGTEAELREAQGPYARLRALQHDFESSLEADLKVTGQSREKTP